MPIMLTHGFPIELARQPHHTRSNTVSQHGYYLEDLSIGGFSLDSFGFGYIRDNMNLGYSDAMNSINESGFTNRTWENIELESDTMIIKGEKLEEEV